MVLDLRDGRYDRQELITWWDQPTLAAASVLVVGAGALGNELAKNLALVGVGAITILDFDVIEYSNLARCVLFRDSDMGRRKSDVAAEAVRTLNPEIAVTSVHGDIRALGLGALQEFDLVIAGLDNREARAWINQATRKLGMTWVDGAIEGLRGVARVFSPDGPCYECTLGEVDRELLSRRRSCALLTEDEMLDGKVPTTATSASIIAAVQVQEAVKLLHGRTDLVALDGRALMFVGETLETYHVGYSEDPDCLVHDRYYELTPYPYTEVTTARGLLEVAEALMHEPIALEFENDLLIAADCGQCGGHEDVQRLVTQVDARLAACPSCQVAYRFDVSRTIGPDDVLADVPLRSLGVPDRDVVTVHGTAGRLHFVLESSA
jgi:molybdopterin/thiamine biosynthesis adenylyltransferase